MTTKTMLEIARLLEEEFTIRMNGMLVCIENGDDKNLADRIEEYRRIYRARDDFFAWKEEQEEILEEEERIRRQAEARG